MKAFFLEIPEHWIPPPRAKGKVHLEKAEKGWNKGKPQDPAVKMEQGDCRAWCICGKCPRGDDCQSVHNTAKRGKTESQPARIHDVSKPPTPKRVKAKAKKEIRREAVAAREMAEQNHCEETHLQGR